MRRATSFITALLILFSLTAQARPLKEKQVQKFLHQWYQLWDNSPRDIKKLSKMVSDRRLDLNLLHLKLRSKNHLEKTLKKLNRKSESIYQAHKIKNIKITGKHTAIAEISYIGSEGPSLVAESDLRIQLLFDPKAHGLKIKEHKTQTLKKRIVGIRTSY